MHCRVTELRDSQYSIRMRQPMSHDDYRVTFALDQLTDMLKGNMILEKNVQQFLVTIDTLSQMLGDGVAWGLHIKLLI